MIWDKIKAWWNSWTLKDVFAVVKNYAANAWSYVVQKWEDFKAWWNSWSLGDIFPSVTKYAEEAQALIMQNWDSLKSWWNSWTITDIFEPVKNYALEAWSYVSQKWQGFASWWDSWSLKDIFPESFSVSWDGILSGWENTKAILSSGWDALSKTFSLEHLSNVWGHLTNSFESAKSLLLSSWNNLAGMLNIDFSGIWDGFIFGFDSACSYISGKLGELTNWLGGGLSSAWNWTKGLLGYGEEAETPEQAKIQEQAKLQAQIQDITVLNRMSEGFSQRVAEMTRAWQPFKASLGEGFEQIYTVMQGIADRIRGVTILAVNELASALSRIASEISSIVQAGMLEVEVKAPNTPTTESYSRTAGGMNRGGYRRHALGGIFTQPHLGLVAEAGREAVIPLENKTRGIPLWKAAGEEMGLLFGNSTTNNDNRSNSMNFSPVYNITVNGGDPRMGQEIRQIIEDVMLDFQDRMQRTSFE